MVATWAAALGCGAPAPVPAGTTQLVTVTAPRFGTTTASLELWERRGACWQRTEGPWRAWLGRSGLSARKREADGATPVGTFRLGPAYGIEPDPGLHLAYRRLGCGDWWDEDPRSRTYNTFSHVICGTRPPFGGGSEALWRISPQYRFFAVIDFNDAPVVAGRGSAIFLHVSAGRPTAGCVSLPETQLLTLLRRLRPAARPAIHLGVS